MAKILTDIRIEQSHVWRQSTRYLFCERPHVDISRKKWMFAALLRMLEHCRHYDVVVTADLRLSQFFGIVRALLGWDKPRHIILELMLDEEKHNIQWKMKNMLQRFCFSAVEVVFVSARKEIQTYSKRLGLPEGRIRFLPFHTNITNPRVVEGEGYILSAGRTGRDFATLARAVEGLAMKVVVVSDRKHVEGITFPANVEVHIDIPYEEYLDLLHSCSLVVIPLKKLVKSTGQVCCLEAMALGKPVVATATVGTEDYIEHGVTGVLVPPEDIIALRDAICRWAECPLEYSAMAARALEQVQARHTLEAYVQAILATAHDTVASSSPAT